MTTPHPLRDFLRAQLTNAVVLRTPRPNTAEVTRAVDLVMVDLDKIDRPPLAWLLDLAQLISIVLELIAHFQKTEPQPAKSAITEG